VYVLITQNCYLGVGVFPFLYPSGLGYFTPGAVLEIPGALYDEQCMTRLGLLPPLNSPAGLVNPWSASLIPWSVISPGSAPINGE
jgi:hypothetical protein